MPQSVPPERAGGLFGGGRLLGGGRRLFGGGRRLLGGGRRLLGGGRAGWVRTGGRCVVGGREESGFLPLSGIFSGLIFFLLDKHTNERQTIQKFWRKNSCRR